jgi:hypothetical protein
LGCRGEQFALVVVRLYKFMSGLQKISSLPSNLPFPTASFLFKMHLPRRGDNPFFHKAGNLPQPFG